MELLITDFTTVDLNFTVGWICFGLFTPFLAIRSRSSTAELSNTDPTAGNSWLSTIPGLEPLFNVARCDCENLSDTVASLASSFVKLGILFDTLEAPASLAGE